MKYLVKFPESKATWESAERVDPNLVVRYLWEQFAHWAYFFIGPKVQKQFHSHCRHLWTKINHAYTLIQKNKPLENNNISETFKKHSQDKLYIAEETTKMVANSNNLKGYHYVFSPHCIKNAFGETVVDFFNLTDS